VLVADDEPFTAEMLALMLAFRGFEVRRAYDGADALEQALEWKPDVLLLDVQMPELEGVEVARALRCSAELCECPVILISSFDECEVAWQDAGANAFLQKPIDIIKLPDMVDRVLHGGDPPPSGDRMAA
jgi:CheY-like chemotaxis protein